MVAGKVIEYSASLDRLDKLAEDFLTARAGGDLGESFELDRQATIVDKESRKHERKLRREGLIV